MIAPIPRRHFSYHERVVTVKEKFWNRDAETARLRPGAPFVVEGVIGKVTCPVNFRIYALM